MSQQMIIKRCIVTGLLLMVGLVAVQKKVGLMLKTGG